jgi:AraC-like DNA-binding protein
MQKIMEVHSKNYNSQFFHIQKDLQMMARQHYWAKPTHLIEVFGESTLLYVAFLKPNQIYFQGPTEKHSLSGPVGILVPPFSVIESYLAAGDLEFMIFHTVLKIQAPIQEARLFRWDPAFEIKSGFDLFHVVENQKEFFCIEKKSTDSKQAHLIKSYLDKNFRINQKMQDIAEELEIGYSTMNIHFRKCFGFAPNEYRNRLRVFESLELMLNQKEPATDACYNSGFEDFSTFYRQFQSQLSAKPSQFRVPNPSKVTLCER